MSWIGEVLGIPAAKAAITFLGKPRVEQEQEAWSEVEAEIDGLYHSLGPPPGGAQEG